MHAIVGVPTVECLIVYSMQQPNVNCCFGNFIRKRFIFGCCFFLFAVLYKYIIEFVDLFRRLLKFKTMAAWHDLHIITNVNKPILNLFSKPIFFLGFFLIFYFLSVFIFLDLIT